MSDPAFENIDEKYRSCLAEMADSQDGYYLIAEMKKDGTPVATCCAFPEGKNYDIGYCVSRKYWKNGFGTEILEALIRWIWKSGGVSVTGEVADANAASIALLRKVGVCEDRKTRYKKWGEETFFDAHYYMRVLH